MAPFARKRFGQHFLHDESVIDRIVEAMAPQAGDAVVEIGPGRGALTEALAPLPLASLDLVELDRDLAALQRVRCSGVAHATVHEADALEFDFAALAATRRRRLRVIGNLPYNVSTPLLFHLLEAHEAIDDLHVMLQKEVIDRIVAQPATGDYGRLTVMLAPWVTAERLFDVGPDAFRPAPRVWSSVARLIVRREPAFAVDERFGRIVLAAFTQRRKTIRNALGRLLTAEAIAACGVDPGQRPETLTPPEFARLAQAVPTR